MAITLNDLPQSTNYAILKDKAGRKAKIKDFIDRVLKEYPSTATRITQFWNDNQADYNKLTGITPDATFSQFFRRFDGEQDLIDLVKPEAIKAIENLLIENPTDDELIKQLKSVARNKKDELPDYFNDATGGITWIIFLIDLYKEFYLNYIPSYINKKLTENNIKLSEIDKAQWEQELNDLINDVYSTFTSTEKESDLEELLKNLNDEQNKVKDLIIGSRKNKEQLLIKRLQQCDQVIIKLSQKIRELATRPTTIIYQKPDTSDTTQPNKPDTKPDPVIQPTKPDEKPTPISDPVIKPTPIPEPDKPVEPTPKPTPEPTKPEDNSEQELQTLKDDINKLSLNDSEKQELGNATTKEQAEAVRAKAQERIKKETDQKAEIAKYDKLLTDIQAENNKVDLADGGKYDQAINNLKTELLPTEKSTQDLQQERGAKYKTLEAEELTAKWQAFFSKNSINEDDDGDDWKKTGLTIEEAQTAFNLNWKTPIEINNKHIPSFTSDNQTTYNIDPLKTDKATIQADHLKKETARKEKEKHEAEWNAFYSKHGITTQTEKDEWTFDKADQAEQVYTDAIEKGVKGEVRKTPLTDEEKKLINSSKSPNEVKANQEQIKNDRKTAKWQAWFTKHSELKNLQNWKDSGFDIDDCENVYNNGWYNNDEVISNKLLSNYTVGELKVNIDPITHTKADIDKVKILLKQIKEAKEVSQLPVNIQDYQADKVPTTLNFQYLEQLKTDKTTEILKAKELKKYNDLLALINDPAKTTFKSLPEDYESEAINNLDNSLLLPKKKEELTARIKERRSGFVLSLNKLDDDAFDDAKLQEILTKKTNKWKANFKSVLTWDKLCKFFTQDLKDMGIVKASDKQKNRNLEQYLLGKEDTEGKPTDEKRGYRIQTEGEIEIKVEGVPQKITGAKVWEQEEEWINTKQRDKQGKLLLPFAYKKNDFDPDNLTDKSFCSYTVDEAGKKKLHDTDGTLAIGTGWGKTTKTIACLQWIMENI